ncbi:ASCH domain-containing protein [Histidinibacterium lentulum]|uniref:ASCH domain-containing protein n=1 Tax=Histidinibacterium lentulum TaxID=2480588 RepID=A0A3N2R801_9RHOB|nr:ASCH domain-containing protein [Histidinibacterium lentulum]ROU03599.1 ASCH domain-containing protein [Histidinibacterium lentulum]
MSRTRETDAMWDAFCAATGAEGDYTVFAFGDGPELMDELAGLVLHGPKRATASLLRDYEAEGAPLPRPGDHSVFLGGDGLPRGIIRTTEIRVGPLSSVDAAFAWDEGEGDRTRADWLDMHTRFFMRQAEAEGFAFHPEIETVFERFDLVWPRPGGG